MLELNLRNYFLKLFLTQLNQLSRFYNPIRVILRGVFLGAHILLSVIMIILLRIMLGKDWCITPTGQALAHWWILRLGRYLGLHIYQYGSPPKQPAFYVGNHISFLDILVVLSITPLNFISKNAVRYWPLIGYIASAVGTIFIKRGKSSLVARVIELISEALKHGRSVMVFPEGTTSHGSEPRKFHSGLFQAAINSNTPIQTVAIRYIRKGELDREAAYVGDDTLLRTLYRIMKRAKTEVHIIFCPPISAEGHDRTELARMARQQVIDALSQQRVAS